MREKIKRHQAARVCKEDHKTSWTDSSAGSQEIL